MTGGDVGPDILCECWPPESVEESTQGGIVPFVAKAIMCFFDGHVS